MSFLGDPCPSWCRSLYFLASFFHWLGCRRDCEYEAAVVYALLTINFLRSGYLSLPFSLSFFLS